MVFKILQIGYAFSPLLGGAIVHGLIIRYNLLKFLKKPIDFKLTLRKRRLFGENKTFRGVLVYITGTALALALQVNFLHKKPLFQNLEILDYEVIPSWLLGFLLGLAAMVSELPNSFIKRQLDISVGAPARGIWLPFFYILDQIDLLIGAWLVMSMVTQVTLERILISLFVVIIIHQVINIIGYFLGMRNTLR